MPTAFISRRAFVTGVAASLGASAAFARENQLFSPALRPDRNTKWSLLDFPGSSFRAKLENAAQEAVGTGVDVKLPSGYFLDLDAPIAIQSTEQIRLSVSGEGMASTAIRCDGVGISLSGAAGSQYSFKGISFLPRQRGRGTALKLNWSEAVVGKGFSIEDVGFGSRGPDKSNYFNRALEIRNKGTGQILGCWFNGLSDVDPQGEGIVLASANDVTVTNTFMYNLAYACRSDGATSLEGFRMHGGSLVRVGHGVYFQSDPVGLPHIEVALSHINAY